MIKMSVLLMMGVLVSGCAADLSSGKKFENLQDPSAGKAKIYFIRDENIMAKKLPYIYVNAARASLVGENPVENWFLKGVVGVDMYVPVEMEPGRYLFKTGTKELVELKPNSITCLEVGGKYRGITLFSIEQIKTSEECKNMLTGKSEGVQFEEALKRIN
jgi:hypothetical protein